jgi:hypothetical protein
VFVSLARILRVGFLEIMRAMVLVELPGSIRPIEFMPFAGSETKSNQNSK